MPAKFDMVLVRWDDIEMSSGWQDTSKAKSYKPIPCYTLGYWLSESKGVLRIASTKQRDGKKTIGDVTTIPLGCVVAVLPLRLDRD